MKNLFGEHETTKRKNFSRCNLGQRKAGDFYQTPPSMTRQFLARSPIWDFPVLEPAAGDGTIEKVLIDAYGSKNVEAYDITGGRDFLTEYRNFPTIITNPPFSLSTEFILQYQTGMITWAWYTW